MHNPVVIIANTQKSERLDKFLAAHLQDISRTHIQSLIKEGYVAINDAVVQNPSYKVHFEDKLQINFKAQQPLNIQAKKIEFDVLYDDEYLAVINKPAGISTHIGAGNHDNTLVHGLVHRFGTNLSSTGGTERPGIVHRLDKGTSGLLIVAKDDVTHLKLTKLISERVIKRTYLAFVWGMPNPLSGTLNFNLSRSRTNRKKIGVVAYGGKSAVTHYKTIEIFENGAISLVECELETGRTHQIRVHLSHIGHPIIADPEYGNIRAKHKKRISDRVADCIASLGRQALHAARLKFTHPVTGKVLELKADLSLDLHKLHALLQSTKVAR